MKSYQNREYHIDEIESTRTVPVDSSGSRSTVKRYIAAHKHLIPAKRQQVAPQGNRGRRYMTEPGEAYQMDWGFTDVLTPDGCEYRVTCFAMVCHHCGSRYIEFFPNAKQENLFIGMIHAFQYLDVPRSVLTDNMKSIVIRRDLEGHPVWQKDYEAFKGLVSLRKVCYSIFRRKCRRMGQRYKGVSLFCINRITFMKNICNSFC